MQHIAYGQNFNPHTILIFVALEKKLMEALEFGP
jgi:hypothetical protein